MSNITSNATVTLTVNGKQAQDMLDSLKKKSQDLEKAIDNAARSGNKQSLKRLQRELKQTNRQIAQIESATVGVEKVLRNLDKATPKELNKALTTMRKQLDGIERGTHEWNRQVEAIKKVKAELARVNDEMRLSEGRWQRFNRILNDWQTTIMGAAAAVTGLVMAGRSAVKAYADMDAEMANVRKFTGMTAEQVEDLNEELKKIDTRTSREDLNRLAEEAGRLGKTSKEDVLGFVKAADQINVALDDLGEGATLTLSKLTSIFGDEERLGTEKSLLAVGSVINELSQNCTAAAPYLANFAKRMAGVGAQAKMTIPQIMGFAAVLDSQGQAVEMSATAVSKLIMDMFKQQDKVIKATGINAEKFKETLSKSTNEGLLMLLDRLHELGNIDVLAPVFKDMGENGARAAQVISALAGNLETIRWQQEEASRAFEEATSVTKEFNVQNNTVQAGLDKARKRVKELAVELGEKLQPVMRHIISSTTLLLKFLSITVDFLIKYRVELITATAAVATYSVALNLAAIKTKVLIAAQAVWNAAIRLHNALMPTANLLLAGMRLAYERVVWQTRGATAAQQAFNRALKANPWGLLLAGLTALVTAVIAYRQRVRAAAEEQQRLKKEAAEAADEIKKVEAKIAEESSAVDRLKKAIDAENMGSSKRNALIKEFNNKFGGYLSKLLTEKSTAADLAAAYAEVVKNLRAKLLLEGKEKDLKENVGTRYGWEAERLAEYDQMARQSGSSMTGAWLKAATDEAFAKGNTSYDALSKEVFKSVARQRNAEGYYDSVDKQLDTSLGDAMSAYLRQYISTRSWEQRVNRKWKPFEDDINSAYDFSANDELPSSPSSPSTPSPSGNGSSSSGSEDKLKAEKDWKSKEEALNRISYAKGEKDFDQYTKRMMEIEIEFHKKILSRTDLTEQERLNEEAAYYEASKKLSDEQLKLSAAEMESQYNAQVAGEKQRYIDGEIDLKTFQDSIELLELEHLRKMSSFYQEGTKEYEQAQKQYQDRLVADQKKRHKEAEDLEKEHQQRLKQLKKEYFGDNYAERHANYQSDLMALQEIYNTEIQMAGDNAKEKLRIEDAFQKAKLALRKKYNIDELSDDKNFLEQWNDDMQEWLQSDLGKAVTGSLDVITSSMSSIFTQMTSLIQAETELQTAAIERRYQSEISNAEGNNYIVKKIEKKKEAEVARIKQDANRKMFAMQVIQAVAQTATAALNAYSSAAAVPLVGYILAPIAAASAVAAGMLQVAAIKKQQQASEAQGYAEGGFTPQGKKNEVAGVVHKGEWVASQGLLQSPVARPMIEALDYAQRTNTIGSLRSADVSRALSYAESPSAPPQTVVVQQSSDEMIAVHESIREYASVIRQLKKRLDEPFVTVNTVTGDTGIKQAQDEYTKLIRNKTPKSRRSN